MKIELDFTEVELHKLRAEYLDRLGITTEEIIKELFGAGPRKNPINVSGNYRAKSVKNKVCSKCNKLFTRRGFMNHVKWHQRNDGARAEQGIA